MDVPGSDDRYGLARFVSAQEGVYEAALEELRDGCKRNHWMWFIFPQIAGLGSSPTAVFFAVGSAAEAAAYLRHPVLGPRLARCADALLGLEGRTVREIMGQPDDMKLRSCMTLFAHAADEGSVYHRVLERYFDGLPDERTLALLAVDAGSAP